MSELRKEQAQCEDGHHMAYLRRTLVEHDFSSCVSCKGYVSKSRSIAGAVDVSDSTLLSRGYHACSLESHIDRFVESQEPVALHDAVHSVRHWSESGRIRHSHRFFSLVRH